MNLAAVDDTESWRESEHTALMDLMQRRLTYLQVSIGM